MTIKTAVLKDFKLNADAIKPNPSYPVLAYLKLHDGVLTKNNMQAFVSLKVGGEDSFLIDEKILMNLVGYTGAEEIVISKTTDGQIFMTDGVVEDYSPTQDIADFPENTVPDSETTVISGKSLTSMGVAANFINDADVSPFKSHVFCLDKFLGGSDSYIMYAEALEDVLPEIILRKDTCRAISKFPSVKFSSNESYHFFESGDYKYGFAKSDSKYLDFSKFLVFERNATSFKINKAEFIRFNDYCVSSSPSPLVYATMEIKANAMHVKMVDGNYNRNTSRVLAAVGDDTASFKFSPARMNKMLRALVDDELQFFQIGNRYFITGPTNFTALISGTA